MDSSLRLLAVDLELGNRIANPAQRRRAFEAVTASELRLEQGHTLDVRSISDTAGVGVLVLEGFIVRELVTAGRTSADLLGPDDVIQTANGDPPATVLTPAVTWTAMARARLALLDGAFFQRAAQWPELAAALVQRAGRSGQRLVLSGAIATLPTIDARVLASLWTWASNWATVRSDGVLLRVPLSHERIGRLIGARRPTVSAAVGRLRREGLLEQRRDGTWLLLSPTPSEDDTFAGVGMPTLDSMLAPPGLGVRRVAGASTPASRALASRELLHRLAEQLSTLQAASLRHKQMLEHMQNESAKLVANRAAAAASQRSTKPRVVNSRDGKDSG